MALPDLPAHPAGPGHRLLSYRLSKRLPVKSCFPPGFSPNPLHRHTAAGMRGLQHKSSQACWVSAILDFAYKMLQEAPALAFAPSPISRQGCSSLPCGQAEFLSGLLSVGVTCRTVSSAWNALPTHSQYPPLNLLPTGPPSPDPGRQFFHASGWVGGWFRR